MSELGAWTALAAGALALLSPCSALMLPAFFAYAFGSGPLLVARTVVFTAGLMTAVVPLGLGAHALSRLLVAHRQVLILGAGWLLVAFGVLTVLGLGGSLLGSPANARTAGRRDPVGWASTFVLGAGYGLTGFCAGPVLGAILTLAATSPTAGQAALLMVFYGVGMSVPLFVLALVWNRLRLAERSWLRGRTLCRGKFSVHTTQLVTGVLFIAVGLLLVVYRGAPELFDATDLQYRAQLWLREHLDGVPPATVPLVVAAVAGLVAVRRVGRQRRLREGGGAQPDAQVDQPQTARDDDQPEVQA